MYGHACRELDSWNSDAALSNEWESLHSDTGRIQAPLPGRSYSRRSAHLAELRTKSEWAATNADEYIRAPSTKAQLGAKGFINNLPDACLDFRLAISQDGEINFFFGDERDLFQILIDESGMLSYYARSAVEEFGDSDVQPDRFQYLKLLQFVERKK